MFGIESSTDFYEMLVADYDEYIAEPQSARRALHCAITAYHLYEWVWGDWLDRDAETKKMLNISDKTSFHEWISRNCIWFAMIREIANGTKHFRAPRGIEANRIMAFPFGFDMLKTGFDEGVWDEPTPYIPNSVLIAMKEGSTLVIDTGDSHPLPATHVLEVMVRFWRDFFKRYRPSPNMIESKNHLDLNF